MRLIPKPTILHLLLLGALFICHPERMMAQDAYSGYAKTKSGLLYKIIPGNTNRSSVKGQFLKLNFSQQVHDSLLYSSKNTPPIYVTIDNLKNNYSITEIFPLLAVGDSAIVVESIDTLARRFKTLPPFLKKGDNMIITLKVIDIFASHEIVAVDSVQESLKERQREVTYMEKYLAENSIKADKTELGAYVVITSPGDGARIDSGKKVSIRFTCKVLPSDRILQSNINDPDGPFTLTVGNGETIPGCEDGLKKFKKGGKGILYIPAFLAYFAQPGPGKTPYENLIFEIEVVNVADN